MAANGPLLQIENCTIKFGGLTAVSELNLELRERELVGLIGPNGAGKTTVFNVVTGVYAPTSGAVRFAGENIWATSRIAMSIEQKPNRLRGRDRTFAAAIVDQFSDRWNAEVFSGTQLVCFPHYAHIFDVDRFLRVDLWSIIMIHQDAAAIRINAGVDRGAINNGGARINRVMISKSHSALRQFPKCGCVLFAHEIGTHPVPNHHDHVSLLS